MKRFFKLLAIGLYRTASQSEKQKEEGARQEKNEDGKDKPMNMFLCSEFFFLLPFVYASEYDVSEARIYNNSYWFLRN